MSLSGSSFDSPPFDSPSGSNTDILNIDNYTKDDLKQFLKIDADTPLTNDLIEQKTTEIIEKMIRNNHSGSSQEKKNMVSFLHKIKDRLMYGGGRKDPLSYIVTTTKNTNTSSTMNPTFSVEPHFAQNIYAIPKTDVNSVSSSNKTSILVFNTIYSDEFLYENRKQINGDSTGAQDYTFTIVNPVKNVTGINLAALQYPNVQPTFANTLGNVFMYIKVEDGSAVEGTIQMSNGYFNSTQMPPVLEYNINHKLYPSHVYQPSPNPNIANPLNPFAVNVSPYTNRVTIQSTAMISNAKFTLIFDMPDWDSNSTTVCRQRNPYYNDLPEYYANNKLQPNTLGFQMGYRAIVYEHLNEYTCEAQYNDSNGGYVFFCLDEFVNNYVDEVVGVFPGSFFNEKVLAMVPINSPHFTNTTDTGANFIFKSRNYTGPVDISKIVISMYTSNGIKIAFNQIPFSFAIQFKIQYENPGLMQEQGLPIYAPYSGYPW